MRDLDDFARIVTKLNLGYFGGLLCPAEIGWTRRTRLPARSIVWATYDPSRARLDVNRMLAADEVPWCFVDICIYHELLHMTHGNPHTELFRAAEMAHPDYERATRWEDRNFERLRTRGPRGPWPR